MPEKLAGEVAMTRDPIRLVMRGNKSMNSSVLINMGKEYPIDYESRVRREGRVHADSIPKLLEYRNEIQARANKDQAT